jgi:glyoxylase-like metal-dependent hydrolase (beta-lactamase superfamily II)
MSDPELMQASLSRLLELPGHLLVCSGHGPVTTLEEELRTNPFLDHVRRARGIAGSRWSSAPGSRWS